MQVIVRVFCWDNVQWAVKLIYNKKWLRSKWFTWNFWAQSGWPEIIALETVQILAPSKAGQANLKRLGGVQEGSKKKQKKQNKKKKQEREENNEEDYKNIQNHKDGNK